MLVRQREDRNERTSVRLVVHQDRLAVSPHLHATHETVRPVIGTSYAILIFQEKRQENVARLQSVTGGVPVPCDQRNELVQDRFGLKNRLVDHVATPNLGQVLARQHVIGTADQSSEEAVQRLKVHRALIAEEGRAPFFVGLSRAKQRAIFDWTAITAAAAPVGSVEPISRPEYRAGAVRLNHPRLDLVRSIGVCPASPPTPQSRVGALF
jgi:hypothetical protein